MLVLGRVPCLNLEVGSFVTRPFGMACTCIQVIYNILKKGQQGDPRNTNWACKIWLVSEMLDFHLDMLGVA